MMCPPLTYSPLTHSRAEIWSLGFRHWSFRIHVVTTAAEKLPIACPQCRRQLLVPVTALGKLSRCPNCQHVFPLEFPDQQAADDEVAQPTAEADANDDFLTQSPPDQTHPAPAIPNPYAPPDAATGSGKYGHGFGWEHRGWDAGVMGGLAMMAIAALWIFVGLKIGIRFHYPIILFIIGLVGFFRGLFTGNVTGKQ